MADDQLLEFIARLKTSDDPFGDFAAFVAGRGAKGFFYGFSALRRELDHPHPSTVMFHRHTYSAEWDREVGAASVQSSDPSIATMLDGENVVEWMPDGYEDYLKMLAPDQRRVVEAEQDMGMRVGASISIDQRFGSFAGMGLWFDGPGTQAAFRKDWAEQGAALQMAAAALDHMVRVEKPNTLIRLTPREIDCMSWLANGMRPAEICFRMGISEKTFEKHIASAKTKLRSRTRDQALAKAVYLGLLDL